MLPPEPPPPPRPSILEKLHMRLSPLGERFGARINPALGNLRSVIGWLWAHLWSWPFVGAGWVLIYGLGVAAMYGGQHLLACLFYFFGVAYLIGKVVMEARSALNARGQRSTAIIVVGLSGLLMFGLSLKWAVVTKNQIAQERKPKVEGRVSISESRSPSAPVDTVDATVEARGATPSNPTTGKSAEKEKRVVVTELSPFVVLKTVRYMNEGKEVRWTDYGLAAILRIKTRRPESVRRLNVIGDVSVDCSEYERAFIRDGEMVGSYGEECIKRKPFYRISWVAWPSSQVGVIQDEQFVKFVIQQPETLALQIRSAPAADYIGFFSEIGPLSVIEAPKTLTTLPRLSDLVYFTAASDNRLLGPRLKQEVGNGRVKFQVELGSETVPVDPKAIREIRVISAREWDASSLQELFYATDAWNRVEPVSKDPLMKR